MPENREFYIKFNQAMPKTTNIIINTANKTKDMIFIALFDEILEDTAELTIPGKAVTQ